MRYWRLVGFPLVQHTKSAIETEYYPPICSPNNAQETHGACESVDTVIPGDSDLLLTSGLVTEETLRIGTGHFAPSAMRFCYMDIEPYLQLHT